MYKGKKVSVVIPTYNEAKSIRDVINGFFETGYVDEVVVIDNNALENTREEVLKTSALLIEENKQGLGNALKTGLEMATGELVVTVDADGTFRSSDVEKLLSYSEDFDVVFGTRTSRSAIWSGAFMPFPVRIANLLWAKFVEFIYNGPLLSDVGCMYRLLSRSALNRLAKRFNVMSGTAAFVLESMIILLKLRCRSIEIPVIFKERVGKSSYVGDSIIRAAVWGLKMLPIIIKFRFKKLI